MKKITTYFLTAFAVGAISASAQNQQNQIAEKAPGVDSFEMTSTNKTEALWDIHFNYDASAASNGAAGMAGALFYNNQYWVSHWATDSIRVFSSAGVLVNKFTIPGLSGTRSFTTDGTYIYAGTASGTIYRITPSTRVLAPPHITLSGGIVARFCTYDATLNGGSGGFWVGNFNTAIDAVSMSGSSLATIAAATHTLTGMYGAAVDYHTAGGPFLWVFHQGGANNSQLTQLKLSTGAPTALTRDVMSDVGAAHSLTSGLAGGCFLTTQVVSGIVTVGGLLQGSPSNVLFGYEIGPSTFNVEEDVLANFELYPNPTTGILSILLPNAEVKASFEVFDVSGRIVRKGEIENGKSTINLEDLANGTFIVKVQGENGEVSQQQIIKRD